MLNRIRWTHFVHLCHSTYERLTLEFLNSYSYVTNPVSQGSIGTIRFRMFNRDYEFSHNHIAALLQFSHDIGLPYEVLQWGPWLTEFGRLWECLTGDFATDMKGKKSSHIHKLAIRYFRQILAHFVFGRGDNGSVNSKVLFFIDYVFKSTPVHFVTFMLTHIPLVSNTKSGVVFIGGLITSIAHALHIDAELATLAPLAGSTVLDIHSC